MDTQDFSFLSRPAEQVAPRLLGCLMIRQFNGQQLMCKIVETEAYSQYDAASHSYRGQTPRTKVMFGPAGHLYVYFTYGMHYCCNIVSGQIGEGSAVLIRAVEPLTGQDTMTINRHGRIGFDIANGPAKLCQALVIDKNLNGSDVQGPPLQLKVQPPLPSQEIVQTTRIGISQAQDVPWRFYIRGNPHVSKQ